MNYANCYQHLEPFGIMSDARATATCSFPGITHISEKDFQMLFAIRESEILTPNRALGQI